MATWNKNNRACTITWTTLRLLHQAIEKFEAAGSITMENLAFWNSSSSPEFRKIQAQTLAFQMDILLDKEKTIADLAEVNDIHHLFWGKTMVRKKIFLLLLMFVSSLTFAQAGLDIDSLKTTLNASCISENALDIASNNLHKSSLSKQEKLQEYI